MADDNPAAPRAALFALPEWHDSRFDAPSTPADSGGEAQDNFLAAMATATRPPAAPDAQAERDFFEVAQRESIAADARRGGSGSQNAICLESGLLNIESGLMALESGLFELSPSGSFEFSNQSSVFDLTSDMFDVTDAGTSGGGVTDAVNKLAAPEPSPVPTPPQMTRLLSPAQRPPPVPPPSTPQASAQLPAPPPQRQVVAIPRGLARREPEAGRAPRNRPEPTKSSEMFASQITSVTGPRLTVRSDSDAVDAGGRYASTTSGHERVSTRAAKIKVRQD